MSMGDPTPSGSTMTESRSTQGSNSFGDNNANNSILNQGNFNNCYIDQRLEHHHKKSSKPWMIPRSVSRLYTGRKEIGDKLAEGFKARGKDDVLEQRRFVITGLGGTGKSEVCIKFAHDHRTEYWGVFWIDCRSRETAQDDFARAGRLCGLEAVDVASVKDWLSSTTEQWLLVIDNADDPDLNYAEYFPSGLAGSIIVTTRNPDSATAYSTVGYENLDQLDFELARGLLLRAAGKSASDDESTMDEAAKVVEELGRHTLAILQAGAFIEESCELRDYLGLYLKQRNHLFENKRKQHFSRYETVHATFEVSVRRLRTLHERDGEEDAGDALDLLDILAFMHYEGQFEVILSRAAEYGSYLLGSDDTEEMLGYWRLSHFHSVQVPGYSPRVDQGAEGKLRWRRACRRLRSFSLISVQDRDGMSVVSMHSLVHQWAKERQVVAKQSRAWWTASCVLALSCQGSRGYISFFELVKSHVRTCLEHDIVLYTTDMEAEDVAKLLLQLGWVQFTVYDDGDLERVLEIIRKNLEAAGGSDTKQDGALKLDFVVLNAYLLERQGQPRQATKMLEHVVSVQEKTLVETHPSRLASQYALAKAYKSNGQIEEAVKILEHVVRVHKKTIAETNPHRLASQHELARAYMSNGQIEEAVKILEHVVSVEAKILAETHPSRLASQHALAGAYESNGQIEEAVKILEHVVSVEARTLAETHPSRLASQHALARAYLADGQARKALILQQGVVRIEKPRSKAPYRVYLVMLDLLAQIYLELECFDQLEAIEEEVQMLEIEYSM